MTDPVHELNLTVGSIFTARPDEDRELYEDERAWLADVQELLREDGVEVDLLSRPGVEVWEGSIRRFADLYQLRLLAAYLDQGNAITPLLADDFDLPEEPDPLLVAIWEERTETRYPHLLNHQAQDGYYLPVDFAKPIWLDFGLEEEDDEILETDGDEDEEEDQIVSFGSSTALQRELVDLEQQLLAARVPVETPAFVCLRALREAADQSVANDLPIVIW